MPACGLTLGVKFIQDRLALTFFGEQKQVFYLRLVLWVDGKQVAFINKVLRDRLAEKDSVDTPYSFGAIEK